MHVSLLEEEKTCTCLYLRVVCGSRGLCMFRPRCVNGHECIKRFAVLVGGGQ